ncbi:efflux transporter outer membrane subunit [Massilia sp. W12]|uniref:efflux transporter outer membrane subunit n=1 Tax=Massilia sp. W12 TaxID=3126507 RepID=UPI0030D49721
MRKAHFASTRALVIALSLALSACASAPHSASLPQYELPASLALEGQGAADWQDWAGIWQDQALQDLLREADARNQDLQQAAARLEEARAASQAAHANLFPALDLYANNSRTRSSANTGRLPAGAKLTSNDFNWGLAASYELDVWGKLGQADAAARARVLAAQSNRAAVRMSLYANVVQHYLNLRALDAQYALLQALHSSRSQAHAVLQKRFAAGLANQLELNLAQQEVLAAAQSLSQAQQARSQTEAALAMLAGRSPAQIASPQIARGADLPSLLARSRLPQDTPSEVLQRRPDVRAAQAGLQAAQADLAQARSLYFPSLRLTAAYGRESREMSDLFSPSSMLWNLAANLTQPIFRSGSIDAVVAGSNARQQQAIAQYAQSVQAAFRDVHDALGAYAAGEHNLLAQQQRHTLAQQNRAMQRQREARGLQSALEAANHERDSLQAELALLEAQRQQLQALLGVYRALGGGAA